MVSRRYKKLALAQNEGNEPRSAALLGSWGGAGAFLAAYMTSYLIYKACLVPISIDILEDVAKRSIAWNLSLFMIGVLICWIFPETPRDFRLHISFGNGLFAILAGITTANAIAWLQKHIGYLEEINRSPITIILIVVLAPIFEEFFFRGIVLNALLKRNNLVMAVVFGSVLFASAHESFWAGFSGQMLLCIVFVLSRRSILISWIAHVSLNCAAMFPEWFMLGFLRGVHH